MILLRRIVVPSLSLLSLTLFANACGGPTQSPSGSGSALGNGSGGLAGDGDLGTGGLAQPGSGSAANSGGAGTGSTPGAGGVGTTGDGDGDGGFTAMPPAGTTNYDCTAPTGSVPPLKLTELAGGLDEPVQVVHAPNDPRLFVVLRDGRVMVYSNGALLTDPFINISDIVVSNDDEDIAPYYQGDRALNAIAFHPEFASNGIFYLYYNSTERDGYALGDAILSEFKVSSDPNVADPNSEQVILHIARNGNIDHHGGGLAFGGDGMMYLGLGDGNSWGDTPGQGDQYADPDGNGQNPSTLLGSLLRISPTPGGGYTSPQGNLPGGAPEVWDYGLRNPFRMTFDGCTGTLYMGDVGFQSYEEINIELPGDGGKNYGWPTMEGPNCTEDGCDTSGLTLPSQSYSWGPATTIIGGAVYRGTAIPALRGKYLYADFLRNWVRYLTFDEMSQSVIDDVDISLDLDSPQSITSLGNGHDGEIYVTTYGDSYNDDSGKLFRLDIE